MLGKKLLAAIFAGYILVTLIFLIATPDKWLGLTQWSLLHTVVPIIINLILVVIAGYYSFTNFDLIDVAVVMLFTFTLITLTLIPFGVSILSLREEMLGAGRMYEVLFPLMAWGVIAGVVLYRVFEKKKGLREKGDEFQ